MTKLSALTGKTTPVGADAIPLTDSEASSATKQATLTNLAVTYRSLLTKPSVFLAAATATAAEIAYASAANRCDGTADQTELNTAIAAGGVILLSSGTFIISAALVDGGGAAKVYCKPDTIIKMVDSSNLSSMLTISTIDSFEWHGGIFDGNRANNATTAVGLITTTGACNNVILEGITVKNSDARGMDLSGSGTTTNPLIVRTCTIQDCDEQGIMANRHYTYIIDCDVHDCGTLPGDGTTEGHHGIKVTGNHCEVLDCRITRINGKGLEIIGNSATGKYAIGAKVVGTTSENNTALGLHLNWVSGATVTGNRFCNNGNNGIDCNHAQNVVITGNNCSFNGSPRGNTSFWASEGSGIFLFMVENVTVTGNVCTSNSQGQIVSDPRSGIRISSDAGSARMTQGVVIGQNVCVDRRVDAAFTVQLNGAITDVATSIAVDTLSSATFLFEGSFTMRVDSEDLVVTDPTVDSNNFVTAGTWTVVRARVSAGAPFTNAGVSHLDNAVLSLKQTQKYGVDLNSLDADTTMVDSFMVVNNICTPNVTGTVHNDYGTSATKVVSGNI